MSDSIVDNEEVHSRERSDLKTWLTFATISWTTFRLEARVCSASSCARDFRCRLRLSSEQLAARLRT